MSLLIYVPLPFYFYVLIFSYIAICLLFLIPNKQFSQSPLHYATKNGHPQLVTFLMENGALKEITDRV